MKYSAIYLFLFTCFCKSWAQPGSLDPSFGDNGKLFTNFGTYDQIYTLAIQTDGKIVVAGTNISQQRKLLTFRYLDNGQPDISFGNGGYVGIPGDSISGLMPAILDITTDNKIKLSGYYTTVVNGVLTNRGMIFVQFKSDGTLDDSFGTHGVFRTPIDRSIDEIGDPTVIRLLPDGSMLASFLNTCNPNIPSHTCIGVCRFKPDYTLDTTFGINGFTATSFGTLYDYASDLAVQPDGKIIAAGSTYIGSNYRMAVVRYNSDGSLDNTFSNDGLATYNVEPALKDQADRIVLYPDGKILLIGTADSPSNGRDIILLRYNSNGALDTGFGNNGLIRIIPGGFNYISDIVVQEDHKILIFGNRIQAGGQIPLSLQTLRLSSEGVVDSTFGLNGYVRTQFPGFNFLHPGRIVLDAGKRILITGILTFDAPGSPNLLRSVIVRYLNELNLGIIDFSSDHSDIFVYPNPLHAEAVLEYTLDTPQYLTLKLYDLNGQLIQTFGQNVYRSAGKQKENLSFNPDLPAGEYILMLDNGSKQTGIQLVKL